MDQTLFSSLLYRGESETLDFKADQYDLDSDYGKEEFLKDLMAFVNAWRTEDAYILLGINGSSGGGANVSGITKQRDDNEFQTLAHGKIVHSPRFSYETHAHEGKQCGVIRIPVQRRPVWLKNDLTKLRQNIVYVRRGSSTVMANPDEIIGMGAVSPKTPRLEVWVHPRLNKERSGYTFKLQSWVVNTGEGTAEDLLVDIVHNAGVIPPAIAGGFWIQDRPHSLRYKLVKPIHPSDEAPLAHWGLAHIATDDKVVTPNKLRYGPVVSEIVIRMRDSSPMKFSLAFTQDEIATATFKKLLPH